MKQRKKDTSNIFYSSCVSNCEVIRVELDDWLSEKPTKDIAEDNFSVDIAIYKRYRDHWSLKEKLRWFWNFLKTGEPFGDGVILEMSEVKRLKDFLDEKIKQVKKIVKDSKKSE